MSIYGDFQTSAKKFAKQAEQLANLFDFYKLDDANAAEALKRALHDPYFRREFGYVLAQMAESNGGKLTLVAVAAVIALALGKIGIVAAGVGIGLHSAWLLLLAAYLLGNELDASGLSAKILSKLMRFWNAVPEFRFEDGKTASEVFSALLRRPLLAE